MQQRFTILIIKVIAEYWWLVLLVEIVNSVPTSANASIIQIVAEKAMLRRLIPAVDRVCQPSYEAHNRRWNYCSGSKGLTMSVKMQIEAGLRRFEMCWNQLWKIGSLVTNERYYRVIVTGYRIWTISTGLHERSADYLAEMSRHSICLEAVAQNIDLRWQNGCYFFTEMGSKSLVDRILAAEGLVELIWPYRQWTDEEAKNITLPQGNLANASIYRWYAGIWLQRFVLVLVNWLKKLEILVWFLIDYLQSGNWPNRQEVSVISSAGKY